MKTTKELIIADITAKVEAKLAKHEVELATFNINDTIKLYNKGLEDLKAADVLRQKLSQAYSKALIILEFNVPGQLDDTIKKLLELGITDKANELKVLLNNSIKKASEYKKLYDLIKIQ